MTDSPPEGERYVLGPDVDLDTEDVRRPDGTRLTEQSAQELADEAVEQYLR
ncbi:MAG: hypothetical protein ACRDSR_11885 [Pseudonocardiaceae bacterium]